MSKKKWLALIIFLAISLGYILYHFNVIPQFTGLVNYVLAYLQAGFQVNPLGIITAVGGAITGVTTGAKLLWDRTKSGLEGSYNFVMGQKDEQLENISSAYNTIKTKADTLQGQFTAVQSELQATKETLTTTQIDLANALSQLQRKQDEINAVTTIKAAELKMANTTVTVDSIIDELNQNMDPATIKNLLTSKGIIVTVP